MCTFFTLIISKYFGLLLLRQLFHSYDYLQTICGWLYAKYCEHWTKLIKFIILECSRCGCLNYLLVNSKTILCSQYHEENEEQ